MGIDQERRAELPVGLLDQGRQGRVVQPSQHAAPVSGRAPPDEGGGHAGKGDQRQDRLLHGERHRTGGPGQSPGEPAEYNVEIYPTSAIVKAGDRLRLTIGTANTFTTLTPLPNLGQELGGTITLLHDSQHASNVLLPFAP